MHGEKKKAHGLCTEYFHKLLQFDSEEFEDDFSKHRDGVFVPAAKVLFLINKKGILNGFNLKYLSLPVEHSMQNNYWAYLSIKRFLKEKTKGRFLRDVCLTAYANEISLKEMQK